MANNVVTGFNTVTATQTISFVAAGINTSNTNIIYEVDGLTLKSYKPDRLVNAITGFTNGKGYYIVMKNNQDFSSFVAPPFPQTVPPDGSIDNVKIADDADIEITKILDGAKILKSDGSVIMLENLNMNSKQLIGLATPTLGNHAATMDYVTANAVIGGGYIPKLSTSGSDSDAITAALTTTNLVDVDVSPLIDADVEIPFSKGVNVRSGALFTGTEELRINGNFEALRTKVFEDTVKVIFGSTTTRRLKPEYFGARMNKNFRANVVDEPTGTYDSLAAFTKAIHSGDAENYPGSDTNFVTVLELEGAYGVTDTISCESKTVVFDGVSQAPAGSMIRYVGDMTDVTAKSIIKFNGCNYGTVRNLSVNAPITQAVDDEPLLAGIQTMWDPVLNFPQRGIVIDNVTVGSPIGDEGDPSGYFEFANGILCGVDDPVIDNVNANNDFYIIRNVNIGRCKVGINNCYDQAVDWLYQQVRIVNCGIAMQFNRGGSYIAHSVYFSGGTQIGCIKGPLSMSDTLRFSMEGVSCEHLGCQYYLHSDGPVYMSVSGGFIDAAFDQQIIPNGLFPIVEGNCMGNCCSMLTFNRISFTSSGDGKMYFDLPGDSNSSRIINFASCTSVQHLYLRFPNYYTNRDHTFININGRLTNDLNDTRQFGNFCVDSRHPAVNPVLDVVNNCYWLKLSDLLKYPCFSNNNLQYVHKGYYSIEPITIEGKDNRHAQSLAQPTLTTAASTTHTDGQVFGYLLPAMKLIKSVIIRVVDSNLMPPGCIVQVGDGETVDKFGTITGLGGNSFNSVIANVGLVYTTDHNIVLSCVDGGGIPTAMNAGKYMHITVESESYNNFSDRLTFGAMAVHPLTVLS